MRVKRLLLMVMLGVAMTIISVGTTSMNQPAQAASKYTIKTFPKRLRGTWYWYDNYDHKVVRIKISAKKMINGKYTSRLHQRKESQYPKQGAKMKHPSWIIGRNFTYKGEKWTQTYGWYQSAGAGDYYRRVSHKIHGKKYATLQMAGGAGIWTDGYGYHTKKAAKANANRWFKGDRHNAY
ncbi:hypothetical protein [Lactobacillus brevis] [Lactiplantibacillus mudanjiangensis]|uniref:hypothetical protein n=1 Tax=Lactiplantibacillus mudanjiangensis TaxID=1296538 RepID=UPI0010145A6A|nr:hypothetical protein [Lactobacillus brevis] [Lactiplantibacillus mudanjiangensis]